MQAMIERVNGVAGWVGAMIRRHPVLFVVSWVIALAFYYWHKWNALVASVA